jgi:hypothetical protein
MQTRKDLSKKVKTGVSLHCHTEYSKEMLDFVPHYSEKLPIISYFWSREKKKYEKREGKPIDFSNSYWSPPLNPIDVYNIEKKQINDAGLEALISLTDHDEIKGNRELNELSDVTHAPISFEWTVPFQFGFFHLGVHNLPPDRAEDITCSLLDYTFNESAEPDNERLHELFELLNSIPDVLVIFNHPIWDIEMAGKIRHEELLKRFLKEHGKWIHALEINGFRSWSENKRVIEMAEALGYPIATGGDRHGCKPNTVLNLTNKKTFSEFVEEIRIGKKSEVVLMPEYSLPLHSRQLESFSEILSHFPDFKDDRKRWFDRIFFDGGDGKGPRSLSNHGWENGGPPWLRIAIRTLGFLGSPTMRPVFSLARKKQDRVPVSVNETKFEDPDIREIATGFSASPESTGSAG